MEASELNLLYVGTLPPHPGGSGITAGLICGGLAEIGHRVRAVAPWTPETPAQGDAFAAANPALSVARYAVPHFEPAPNEPSPAGYRRHEFREINRVVPPLIEADRPDVILSGRETFARYVPDIAARFDVPCVQRMAGAVTWALTTGALADRDRDELLTNYRKVAARVAPGHHMKGELERLGSGPVDVLPNPVDLGRFRPGPRPQRLMEVHGISDRRRPRVQPQGHEEPATRGRGHGCGPGIETGAPRRDRRRRRAPRAPRARVP